MENPFASPVVKLTAQTHAHKALFARLILVVLLAAIFSAASFSAAGAQATARHSGVRRATRYWVAQRSLIRGRPSQPETWVSAQARQ